MIDTIAYQIGHTKIVIRDTPEFIECHEETLQLIGCPYTVADSSMMADLTDLFKGMA